MHHILLDHSVPAPLVRHLPDHQTVHTSVIGWDELANGELLVAAEANGYAVFITSDQNIRYQQNLAGRRLSIIELNTNHWDTIRARLDLITAALSTIQPGEYVTLAFPQPVRRRRRTPKPTLDC